MGPRLRTCGSGPAALPSHHPAILPSYHPTGYPSPSYHLTILPAYHRRVAAKKNHAREPVDTTNLKSLLARPKRGEEESWNRCVWGVAVPFIQACLSLSLSVCLSVSAVLER